MTGNVERQVARHMAQRLVVQEISRRKMEEGFFLFNECGLRELLGKYEDRVRRSKP